MPVVVEPHPVDFFLTDSPEEFLTVHLVQLARNILDGVLKSWDYNMFNSIDTAVGGSDDFIQDHESRLQRGQLDKCFDSLGIDLFGTQNLLTTAAETSQIEI